MPRDSSGIYTLPLAPVVAGTPIEATWANTTMNDMATAMTESLSRQGNGGMQVALKLIDGVEGTPGLNFNSEPGSGIYRAGAFDNRYSIAGEDMVRWYQDGVGDRFFQYWDGVAWRTLLFEGGAGQLDSDGLLLNATTFDGFGVSSSVSGGAGITDITFNVAASATDKQNVIATVHSTDGSAYTIGVDNISSTVVRVKTHLITGTTANAFTRYPIGIRRTLIT